MSQLTEALERISIWIEKHQLEEDGKIVPVLAPGLTREQIDIKVKDMPFVLSEEIYQLYQWANGADEKGSSFYSKIQLNQVFEDIKLYASFWVYQFFSLERALKFAIDWEVERGKCRILIFSKENGYNCALVDGQKRYSSPIVDDGGLIDEHLYPLYPSITDMMVKYAKQMEDGYLWFD